MILSPFAPLGNTVLLAANASAPTGIQAPVSTGLGTQQYQVANTGTQIVYLSYANSAAGAQSNAVIPTGTGASATTVIPLLPNTVAIYTFPAGSYFSGITPASGATNVMITPGEGA